MNIMAELTSTIDINTVYEQINGINIPLEIQHGYNGNYLDVKFVECDAALDKLDKMITNVTRELTNYEIRRSIVDEGIENKKRNELTNNKDLRKQYPTAKEREIAVEMMLKEDLAERCSLDRHILGLENLLSVIKTKYSSISKKTGNVKDQFRRMGDLVRAGGVSMAPDKDTALLMQTLADVERREKEFDIDNVEEAEENVGQDSEDDISVPEAVESLSTQGSLNENLDEIEIDISVTTPSPVTHTEPDAITETSEDVVLSSSNEGNNESDSLVLTGQDDVSSGEEASSEEEEGSELDMDTILDGLDTEEGSETISEEESAVAEPEESEEAEAATPSTISEEEGDEGLILEDIFSSDDAAVTDEPANKKPGQGEPTSKEKSKKKEVPKAKVPPAKSDNTVSGDVDIDNILDTL